MATVLPFRAWRYNLSKVGGLDRVTAPPYDVVGPHLHVELYRRSPYNVVRVDLPRSTEDDTETDNRYTRASALLEGGKEAGVLVRDDVPGVSVVEEMFVGPDGAARIRRGFLAVIRLHPYDERVVFPHEATLTGPKEDRFQLMVTTGMSLSPIFLLYSLPGDEIMNAWLRLGAGRLPVGMVGDPSGTLTRLWRVSEADFLHEVTERLRDSPLLIADGHHRYETALRYRRMRREQGDGDGPWDYALAYLVNMEDPGLAIFATHRMLGGLPEQEVRSIPDILSRHFVVHPLATSAGAAPEAIRGFLASGDEHDGVFGLYVSGLEMAYGLTLRDTSFMSTLLPDQSEAYRRLDVTILQKAIFEDGLGITSEDVAAGRHVSYIKDWGEGFGRLEKGEFQVGFFMRPTPLRQVQQVAMGGERMPQKSTFFYPKLPTGLVFFDLEDHQL